MKLASLKEGGRDGTLIVVDKDIKRAVRASGIAPSLQKAARGLGGGVATARGVGGEAA